MAENISVVVNGVSYIKFGNIWYRKIGEQGVEVLRSGDPTSAVLNSAYTTNASNKVSNKSSTEKKVSEEEVKIKNVSFNGRKWISFENPKSGDLYIAYEASEGEFNRVAQKYPQKGLSGDYKGGYYVWLGTFIKNEDGTYGDFFGYPTAEEKNNGNYNQLIYFKQQRQNSGQEFVNFFIPDSTEPQSPTSQNPTAPAASPSNIELPIEQTARTIVSAAEALRPDFTSYNNQQLTESTDFITDNINKDFETLSKVVLPETENEPAQSLSERIKESGITEDLLNDPRLTPEQREALQRLQDNTSALDSIIDELKQRAEKACPKALELGTSWSKATSQQLEDIQKSCKDGFNFTELAAKIAAIENKQNELANPCGEGTLAGISNALTNFFDTLKGLKKYYNLYVQKSLNKISSLTSLVGRTSQIIAAILKLLVQRMRNYILNLLRKLIEKTIDRILKKLSKSLKNTFIKTIVDSLICKFNEIIKGLRNLVVDFLYALIGNVINMPICAVEQFTNALINNLSAKIDQALQPVLSAINDVLGGVAQIGGQIFQAIDFILGFEAFLCSRPKCPSVKAWRASAGGGPTPAMEENWNKVLSFIPEGNQLEESILSGVDSAIGGLLPGVSIFGDERIEGSDLASGTPPPGVQCFPGALRCGPPKVEFFGGGGAGAVGNAVVNSIGEVVGVDLFYGGGGYTAPPFITFQDSCSDGNPGGSGGFGASAYTIINNVGQVVEVVMVDPGKNYLNYVPGTTESDTPAPINPDREQLVTREYVTCLDKIDIINTGIGYLPTDTISITPDVPGLEVKVQITEVGQIVAMEVLTSGCGFAEIPNITINSASGVGLEVRPRMRFINRKTYLESQPDFVPSRLIKVVDCVLK